MILVDYILKALTKARHKSSRQWLAAHRQDAYVKAAQRLGYRSRAAFKLAELDQRERLLRPGLTILDLGAAPGGWSQYAAQRVGPQGRVLAVDLLPMAPISGVTFIQGDFTDMAITEQLKAMSSAVGIDLVICDVAPNITGINAVDQPRALGLTQSALSLAQVVLKPTGGLLAKAFQGEGFADCVQSCRHAFKQVAVRKPKASRPTSREVYILAQSLVV